MALHPDRDMRREQDSAYGIALAGIQPCRVQPGLDRLCRRQASSGVKPLAHAGDNLALGVACPVGDEGEVAPPRRRFDQVSVAPELGDTGVQRFERVPPAPVRQRPGAQVVGRDHRAPLLQVLDRLPRHRQRRRRRSRLARGKGRCADPVAAPSDVPVERRAELLRPFLPCLVQNLPNRLRLAPPRVERCLLRPGGGVLPASFKHVVQKLPASGRERVQHRLAAARDLGPRHPAHKRRHRGVADLLQPRAQLVAVVGADQALRAFHGGELGATPLHSPFRPRVMLASTACVCSCGSRLRLARWRKVAAAMPCACTRGLRPVAGSKLRVWSSSFSMKPSVLALLDRILAATAACLCRAYGSRIEP